MRISPTGQSEYYDGHEIGRYGRSPELGAVLVWYATRLRRYDEPAWGMDTDLEWQVSISPDWFVVVDQPRAYLVDRTEFTYREERVDGQPHYVVKESDDYVTPIEDPNDVLRGKLYIESGNQVDEGYHKQANES